MNERIEQLAEQAGLSLSQKDYSYYWVESKEDIEKFAELIVRECIGISDDYVKDCTCEDHVNCKHPRSAIGRKIREHFGVSRGS